MRRQESTINAYREQLQQQAGEAAAAAERSRLARDLHDSIKQQLFSIRMSALVAQTQIERNTAQAQEALADIQRSAQEAQVEMQALLQQLRSTALENTSFAEAVRTQAQALEYRSGARVQVELADLPALERCPLAMQEELFRIIQEALANIARHARAYEVTCKLTHDAERLTVLIRDDGQGFELAGIRKGMGLANIMERARGLDGVAEIESAPGRGTTVHVQIPLLLPAGLQQEQERREQKARELAASARVGLQLRSTMAVFTLLVLLIDIDLGLFTSDVPESRKELVFFILIFCLCMMFYGLVRARFANARLKTYRGSQDREPGSLRLREQQGWVASLRLALFSSWHVVVWTWRLFQGFAHWQVAGGLLVAAGLILALVLLVQDRLKSAQESYYRLLPVRALKRELTQRVKMLRIRLMLALCIAISFFAHGLAVFFAPVLPWQWLAYSFLFAFFIQCLCLVLDFWRLRPWRRLVASVAQG